MWHILAMLMFVVIGDETHLVYVDLDMGLILGPT